MEQDRKPRAVVELEPSGLGNNLHINGNKLQNGDNITLTSESFFEDFSGNVSSEIEGYSSCSISWLILAFKKFSVFFSDK